MPTITTELSQLGPHVPRVVREWIDDDPSSIHRQLAGTMVLIDVSGFTRMSERLGRFGKAGAEAVTSIIGDCFNRLLGDAYSHGATLLKFGGDALLLFFQQEGHAARACSAAIEMRKTLREVGVVDTAAGRLTLRMTAGVHTDTFDFFLVGDSHRELLVAGPAASEMVRIEGAAASGRILLSARTSAELRRDNLGKPVGPGRLLRGAPPSRDRYEVTFRSVTHDLRAYVPTALRTVLAEGAVPSEHRQATMAFAHIGGLDALVEQRGPEAAARRLDDLLGGFQQAIDARQVCFLGTDLAGDGFKLLLTAGVPASDGEDEERLLLAAQDVLGHAGDLPVRIGVNAGHVLAGEIGTVHRRAYTVMGDAVNLAARIMARAEPGQLLSTHTALQGSRTLFEVEELAPFLVKGKRLPVVAFTVGPPRAVRSTIASTDLPLIGRDRELTEVLDTIALFRAEPATAPLVEIVGEAGAGKSRFVDEVLQRAAPVAAHRVQGRQYQASTPYFAVAELLREVLDLPADDRDAASARLTSIVTTAAPHLLPWLSLLAVPLGLPIADSPEAALLEDSYRKRRLEQSVGELLDATIDEPTILTLEDVHWLDDASADVLQALARSTEPRWWLLCVTRRASDIGFVPEEDAAVLRVELAPLEASSTTDLLAAATAGAPVPREILLALGERAGGHPLFALELLNAWREGNALDALPRSVEGLISARIDRLPQRDRTLLRHLAVLGHGFELNHAAAVLDDEQTLTGADLLRLDTFLHHDGAETAWVRFRHALVRDVAYAGLTFATRRQLHGQVADSILRASERPDEQASMLSLHFFHAHRFEDAWTYGRQAGHGARALYANLEAIVQYERAISASKHLPALTPAERAEVLEALGDVQELAGRYPAAHRSYVEAQRLLAEQRLRMAELDLKLAFLDERQGRYVGAIRCIRRGQRRLAETEDDELETDAARVGAQLTVWYAAVRAQQGRGDEAAHWSRVGIEMAEAAGDRPALARAHLILDYAEQELGVGAGGSGSQVALEIYEQLGDLSGQATASNNLGVYAYHDGRWGEAVALYGRARDARLKTGSPAAAAMSDANTAEILLNQGHWDEAAELLHGTSDTWRATGDAWGVAFAEQLLGMAAARRGDLTQAQEHLEAAHREFAAIGARPDVLATELAIAEHHVLAGRPRDALATLHSLTGEGPSPVELGPLAPKLHRLRGLALFQTGSPGAEAELREAVGAARSRHALYELALALEALELVAPPDDADGARRGEHEELFARLGVVRRLRLPSVPAR